MIHKELYIKFSRTGESQSLDIQDINIVRNYKTPYFSDVNNVYANGSLTVKIPLTERNAAIFGYCDREDMFTDIPYKLMYADYYVNALPIFLNAEVKILDTYSDYIDVQFVYGINREKYLPLFQKRCNEITTNGTTATTIPEDKWIVNWTSDNMYAAGKKYKYVDYVSVKRTSPADVITGVVQPKVEVPAPYLGHEKNMTMHPFIDVNNVLDVISADADIEEFDVLKDKFSDVGIIETTRKDNYKSNFTEATLNYSSITGIYGIPLIYDPTAGTSDFVDPLFLTIMQMQNSFPGGPAVNEWGVFDTIENIEDYTVFITLKFKTTKTISCLYLYKLNEWSVRSSGVTTLQTIYPTYSDATYYYYDQIVEFKFDNDYMGRSYFIGRDDTPTIHFDIIGTANINYELKQSLFTIATAPNTDAIGRFDCLQNLPNMKQIEFISEMLKLRCGFLGSDINNDFKFYFFENFVSNLQSGNVTDWSGRVSNVRKGSFKFNSNAQNNWAKYNNWKDFAYTNTDKITVSDETIESEKDLININFDLADRSNDGRSEILLYEQSVNKKVDGTTTTVSFDNKYSEKPLCLVKSVTPDHYNASTTRIAYNEPILPNTTTVKIPVTITVDSTLTTARIVNLMASYLKVGSILTSTATGTEYEILTIADDGNYKIITTIPAFPYVSGYPEFTSFYEPIGFIDEYYQVYQKLINRPIIREIDINIDFYESANIDFEKPIYIKEWGKYCVLLELNAPDEEVCTAKLLLINESL